MQPKYQKNDTLYFKKQTSSNYYDKRLREQVAKLKKDVVFIPSDGRYDTPQQQQHPGTAQTCSHKTSANQTEKFEDSNYIDRPQLAMSSGGVTSLTRNLY